MNNHSVPDWNFESDLPVSNQKRILGQDNELVELLWQNGQVVLRSQTHKSHTPIQRNDQATLRGGNGNFSFANSTNLIHDDETVSWIRYPSEDYLEREFCSNLLSELQQSDPMETDNNKPNRQSEHHQHQQPQFVKSSFATATATAAASCPATLVYNMAANSQQLNVSSQSQPPEFRENPMPPPKFQFVSAQQNKKSEGLSKIPVFSPVAAGHTVLKNNGGNLIQKEAKECSGMTVGSSFCGSNQVRNDNDFSRGSSNAFGTTATGFSAGTSKEDVQKKAIVLNERGKAETMEPTVTLTSSSGGSGSSFDKTCKQPPGVISSHKRKSRDGEEFECQSEAAELQSAAGNKPAQRPGTGRRSRAAEVHNLSERRRRDRINEKMRALQELIPHCNKTDKASMLDEAIEYLKSLQLQLQVMWMGNGMAPMMFPGIQHYMSRMGMGMGVGVGLGMGPPPAPLPSVHNPMHLSRVPVVDPSMSTSSIAAPSQNQTPTTTCQIQQLNPVSVNYQQHFQTPTFPEQYARFLGFHHMQTASQPVNMFGYGTQTAQQNPVLSLPSNSNITFNGGAALTNNTSQSGKMG